MFGMKEESRMIHLEWRVDELEYRLAVSEMKNWNARKGNTPPPPTCIKTNSDFENRDSKMDCQRVLAGMRY